MQSYDAGHLIRYETDRNQRVREYYYPFLEAKFLYPKCPASVIYRKCQYMLYCVCIVQVRSVL